VVAHIRSSVMSAFEAKNVVEVMKGLVAAKREVETLTGRDSLKRFKMSPLWKQMNNTVKLRNKYVEIASEVEHSVSVVQNSRMGWLCRQMFRHGENYTLSAGACMWLTQQQVAADVTSRRDQVDPPWWGSKEKEKEKAEDSDSPDDEKDEIEEEEAPLPSSPAIIQQRSLASPVVAPVKDEEAERQAKLAEEQAKIEAEKRAKREVEVRQIRAEACKVDDYLRDNARPDFLKLAVAVGLPKPTHNPFSGEPVVKPPTLLDCLPDSEVNDRNRAPSSRDRAVSFFPKQRDESMDTFQPQSKVCLSAFSAYVQQEFPDDAVCIQFLAEVHRFVNMDLSTKTAHQAQRLQRAAALAIYNKFNATPAMQRSNRATRQKIAATLGLDKPKPLAVIMGSSDEDEPPPPEEDSDEDEGAPPPPDSTSEDEEDKVEQERAERERREAEKAEREKVEKEKLEKEKEKAPPPPPATGSESDTDKPAKPMKPSKSGRMPLPNKQVPESKVEPEIKSDEVKKVGSPKAPTRPAPVRGGVRPPIGGRPLSPPQAPPRPPATARRARAATRKVSVWDPLADNEDFDQDLFNGVCAHVRTYLSTIFSQFQDEPAYATLLETYTREKSEVQVKRRHDWEVSQAKKALQAVLTRRDAIKPEIEALEEKEFQERQREKAAREAADAEAGKQEEARLLAEETKRKEEVEAAAAAEAAEAERASAVAAGGGGDSDNEEQIADLEEDLGDDVLVEERKPINPLDPVAQPEASAPTFASDLKPSAAPGAWGAALEVVKQMKGVREKPKGWKVKQGQEYRSLIIDLVHPGGTWMLGEEKCHFVVTVDSYALVSKDLTPDPHWSDRFHIDIMRSTQFLEVSIRKRDGGLMGVVALSLHDIIKAQNRKKKKLMEQHQAEQAKSGKVWVKFDPSEKELQTFRRLQAAEYKTAKGSVRPAVKLSVFISTSRAVDDNEHRQLLDSNKRLNPESGHRFQLDGFDLDLTYLAHNVAVMASPDGHFKELTRFLRMRHPRAFKVYNLCSEVTYEASQFQGNVVYFPMPYHEPCPLDTVLQLVEDLRVWLLAHPQNVALIHCKDGGAASSFVFTCYCVFVNQLGEQPMQLGEQQNKPTKVTVGEAMAWFQKRRQMGLRSMASPSQLRYASHVQSYCEIRQNRAMLPGPCHLAIHSICILNLPNQKASDVFFAIKCRGREAYLSVAKKMVGVRTQSGKLKFDLSKRPLVVSDDVVFKFYRRTALGSSDKMLEFSFHSRYLHLESEKRGKDGKRRKVCRLLLPKSDLDRACIDANDTKFHKKFGVKVSFEPTLTARALKEYELFHEVIECVPLSFYGAPNQEEAGILPPATFQTMTDMPLM